MKSLRHILRRAPPGHGSARVAGHEPRLALTRPGQVHGANAVACRVQPLVAAHGAAPSRAKLFGGVVGSSASAAPVSECRCVTSRFASHT